MNGFLVIGRTVRDDVPMKLCPTLAAAESFASAVTEGDVTAAAEDVFDVSPSNVQSVDILEIRDGTPQAAFDVKRFDG